MEIWLDTVDLEVIVTAKQMGVLYGITTNPSIIAKSNRHLEDVLEELLDVQTGPVTAQVTALDASTMVEQAKALYTFSPRMIVKVPVTTEGLKAIQILKKGNISVMATAVFEPSQVLLAAHAGACYVAPYLSSMLDVDHEGRQHFKTMHDLLDRYHFNTKLLAASLKSKEQVNSCVEMGVHAVTLNRDVFLSIIENHPETMRKVEKFLEDWQTAAVRKTLPL